MTTNIRISRISAVSLITLAAIFSPVEIMADDSGDGTEKGKTGGPKIPPRHNHINWHIDGRLLTVDFPENIDEVNVQLFSMDQCVWTSTISKEYPSAEIPDNLHGCFILTIQPSNPDFQPQNEMMIL